ncbi:hypothetical protein TSUD_329570 [Trifolium subterraneum]|nr:hypothetical protein TSUD_329570 [Trifolium subterraneum]
MQGISSGGGGGSGGGSGGGNDPATDHLFASSPVPPHFLHPVARPNSDHFMPFVPVPAIHHQQQMAAAAAAHTFNCIELINCWVIGGVFNLFGQLKYSDPKAGVLLVEKKTTSLNVIWSLTVCEVLNWHSWQSVSADGNKYTLPSIETGGSISD